MKRRRRPEPTVFLPWESKYPWLRHVMAGGPWVPLLAVMAVLTTGLLGLWRMESKREGMRVTRVVLEQTRVAVARFRRDYARCPRSLAELTHPPRGGQRYLSALPRDGWGHVIRVRCPSPEFEEYAEIISAGPSGSFFVDDNVQ